MAYRRYQQMPLARRDGNNRTPTVASSAVASNSAVLWPSKSYLLLVDWLRRGNVGSSAYNLAFCKLL